MVLEYLKRNKLVLTLLLIITLLGFWVDKLLDINFQLTVNDELCQLTVHEYERVHNDE